MDDNHNFPTGQRISLPGHFADQVILESVRRVNGSYECCVRLNDGTLAETVLSPDEAQSLLGVGQETTKVSIVDANKSRLLIESARIRLAYAHDSQFAVSLSGIQTLPHQIEAVYMKMLPQPRLRFLLADDPGAGKTIMAGLLIKEMKLRQAIERILILCPAPLTIQWQDELSRWFGESFEIIFSALDQKQLVDPWQRHNQVISSIDYAKQEGVCNRVWQQKWDLLIIDEAHKCSAYTKHYASRSDNVEKTKRYQLAERLARDAAHVVLLTATPHHGDDDRFAHFIRLLDSDLFPEPHRVTKDKSKEIRRNILRLGADCPWALRRLKEDLKNIDGQRLFPDRHASTMKFCLNHEEYNLYKEVTTFINRYLPQTSGKKRASVALARTVLQRRLASSTRAICASLLRRLERQKKLLQDLEELSISELEKKLMELRGYLDDAEQDDDDLDEEARDRLVNEVSSASELEHLRTEIAALQDLYTVARRVQEHANDSKLAALKECLAKAEFRELTDGRGKLLIFTEHRDTMNYISDNLREWRYSVCNIHGGMNPRDRKKAQEEFRTACQVCVATEAAGEGINLQFCHLMINYDLPWNPTRLEQRLGRIHRIGQDRDCHVFNFVASDSEDGQLVIEGKILHRLLEKIEQMRETLANRVFDVIGEVLSLNKVNLPDMLREAACDPKLLDKYLDQIAHVDPSKLQEYEDATGIALARANVDFSRFQKTNAAVEERRLMPRYVERHFVDSCQEIGLKVDHRADGLWRIPHVLADLRSEQLACVRKSGKPEAQYRKLTFHKEILEQDRHLDAVLLGPGHPLYAAVEEKLNNKLGNCLGGTAVYTDPIADRPYRLHFFEMTIYGQDVKGDSLVLQAEVIAVREDQRAMPDERYSIVSADCLLDLAICPEPPNDIGSVDAKPAADFLKSGYQIEVRGRCREERQHFLDVCKDYLPKSFTARIRAAEDRAMDLSERERENSDISLARERAENELMDLKRLKEERMNGLNHLNLVRPGPVRHLLTAVILPADTGSAEFLAENIPLNVRQKSEKVAEDVVIAFEEKRGWRCERVGREKIGFDIRSIGPTDPETGYYDPNTGIRRIEVKGRIRGQAIRLTTNEWYKAAQLGDSYWLYVVWDPLNNPDPEPLRIQNPAKYLDHAKKEVRTSRFYDIPANAVEQAAQSQMSNRK